MTFSHSVAVHVGELAAAVDAGRGHHAVQAAHRFGRLTDGRFHGQPVRNVHFERLDAGHAADIAVQHHGRSACLQDGVDDGGTQSGSASGNQYASGVVGICSHGVPFNGESKRRGVVRLICVVRHLGG